MIGLLPSNGGCHCTKALFPHTFGTTGGTGSSGTSTNRKITVIKVLRLSFQDRRKQMSFSKEIKLITITKTDMPYLVSVSKSYGSRGTFKLCKTKTKECMIK